MTPTDAFALLTELNAQPRLITHVRLVGEAGDLLLGGLRRLGVKVDAEFVRAGIVLHDVGKILHPNELDGGGSQHEPDGEKLLSTRGVDPRLARVCRSHARWVSIDDVTFEELVIAVADKKGVRGHALEERVIDEIARMLGRSRWDLFTELDDLCESIAAGGALPQNPETTRRF